MRVSRRGTCLDNGEYCAIMTSDVLVRFISKVHAPSHFAERICEVCMVTLRSVSLSRAESEIWAVSFFGGVCSANIVQEVDSEQIRDDQCKMLA